MFEIDEIVVVKANGEHGAVVKVDNENKQIEVWYGWNQYQVLGFDEVEPVDQDKEDEVESPFARIGKDIGEFTASKNQQYGSSVDATHDMMKVLMERYRSSENTYTIPESLLPHILLQVRMMDKQNRIFNNPSGEGDSESPYKDLTGYSIIGVEMVERNNQ